MRGLAVIGMVFAHTGHVGVWGEELSALVGISHGHSSILFAVVAGLSLGMISGGTTPPTGPELLRTRLRIGGRVAALLVLSGMLAILPADAAVILASYALWFVLAIPCLRWRPRWLLIAGVLHLALGRIAADVALFVLSWAGIQPWGSPEDFVPTLLLTGTYPAMVWMGFVLIGLAMARSGIHNGRALTRFTVAGLAAFLLASAPFVILDGSPAPVFGVTEDVPVDTVEVISDWCLDAEAEELYPCTTDEYFEQEESFTDEEYELYWMLYDELPHDSLTALCLDVDTESLYWCTPEQFDALQGTLTPAQAELQLQLELEVLGNSVEEYWSYSFFTLAPHSGSAFEALSSGGLAVFLVGAFVLVGRSRTARLVMAPLAAVGAMALTAYAAHIVVMAYVPNESSDNLYATWLAVGLVVGSLLWRRVFTSGPLENATGALADRAASTGPLR